MAVDPALLSALNVNVATTYGVVIDPQMVSIKVDLRTPLYDRLMSIAPMNVRARAAAIFGTFTSANFSPGGQAAFAAGGDPYGIEPVRALNSIVKKSYGASGAVKDVDVIASTIPGAPISIDTRQFVDDAALLLELLYVKTRRGIDMDTVKGSVASDANAFNGLETLVTSSTSGFYLNANSAVLSPAMIDETVVKMMASGVYPTAIYCNPILHKAISDVYQARNGASIQINDNQTGATVGLWVTSIVTPAGRLPIVSDPFFTLTAGTAPDYTGNIYIMTEQHEGVPLLYYEWMLLPTAIPLAKVMGRGRATSSELAVWAHLCLVERTGGWAHGLIANVKYSTALTPAVPTE